MNRYVFLSALSLGLLSGCSKTHESEAASTQSLPTVKVQAATVHLQTSPSVIDITGTVRPAQRATLAAKVMGAVEELPVSLGQRVKAGDALLRISAAEITARVTQARAGLNVAQRDFDRENDLLTKGASTADMVRALKDRLTMSEAMVREAETMLGYTIIRAPFDGVVARKFLNAGDLAAPGMPLLEIEGSDHFQIEAAIPASLAAGFAPGTQVEASLPSAKLSVTVTLVEISSAADAGARSIAAKFDLPAGLSVRSGDFARLSLPGASTPSLLAPVSAISLLGQMTRVFVVGPDNRAVLRLVKTGATRGTQMEVLSGLDDGERVVLLAPPGLREGQPLEVTP